MANIRPLSPALAEKARLELNEDSKRVADDIKHLKDWIAKQPYLRARTVSTTPVAIQCHSDGIVLLGLSIGAIRTLMSLYETYAEEHGLRWEYVSPRIFSQGRDSAEIESMHHDVVMVYKGLTALSLVKQNWQRLSVMSTSDRVWKSKEVHDDQWLLTFLRGCKFSLERTKEKLDLYYSMRSTAPEMYKLKHTDPLFEEILDLGTLIILPKVASPDAPRITLIRPENYCSNKYSVFDMMAVSHIIQKIVLMEDDNATVAGSVSVLDLENVTMSILVQMTPTTLKKIVVAGQDALPLRLKGAHFLNTPSWFETAFNTTKSLLSEKNRKRVYVHNNNIDSLYEYVPKDILPTEYGGNGGSINEILAYWKNKVKEYSDFLEEDMQFGTDETKRPDKPKTAEEMFGAEGSFRKLEFD